MAVRCDAPFLPEDIMVNILKRLPVKSLIRFQCVCKHWKNLFKTSLFVTDHLHYSSAQYPSLLVKPNRNCQPLHLSLIDGEINALQVQIPPLIGSLPDVTIEGSCNGLLCIATDMSKDSLFLWNPATREVRQVPATRPSKFPRSYCILGFGFSEIVDDYKIVKAGRDNVITGVKMYSLRTDSWKNIEFGSLEGLELLNYSVNVNGVIFWSAVDSGCNLIVSFDIATEVFTLIRIPTSSCLPDITVFEDKFAILYLFPILDNSNDGLYYSIDLSVLEEDIGSCTERWSWSQKYDSSWSNIYSSSSTLTIWRNEFVSACDSFRKTRLTNEGGQDIENQEENVGLYFLNIITNERMMFAIPEYSR
ncbi:hypothetical protein QN277_011765 [Acacia crassicarpa]|uniref:F-box domain-containing protein n=1 Tax=Acacia crassicarpa TaxID=499986 RepID=A0AAE1MZW0_9FABA|nr:hypothetical protein QN277_011765 [Acacia crassicarpa]